MNTYSKKIKALVLRSVCHPITMQSTASKKPGLYRTRVLGGFLQGMSFSMPKLERLFFALGSYETHIVRSMQRLIKPGDTVYDIGANAGYFTLVMSKLVQSNGAVFSFEPDPANFMALSNNIQDNSLKVATPIQKAISDSTGELTFATFEYSLVGHIATKSTPDDATLIKVDAITLDDFVYKQGFPSPKFIKIDVEGAEDRVLFGADRVLREAKPVILAEVREGEIYENITRFLTERGYRFEFLKGGWQREKHQLSDMLFIPSS